MSRVASALADAVGSDAVEEHAPVTVDGAAIRVTARPPDGAALGRALAALSGAGFAAVVRGGGSRLACGNPPHRADAILATDHLSLVDTVESDEGVCHAQGGTPLAQLRKRVEAGGWELPLDPPGAKATLGGALAAAAQGPRSQGYGLPRDVVLGMEVALASGERTRCGGRVVKNVTGYDMNKLYTGSFGTLGVIEGVWLRLRPRPERAVVLEAPLPDADAPCELGLAAARRATARVAAVQTRGEALLLVVEFAGSAAGVESDAAWLVETAAALEVDASAVDRLRECQGALTTAPGIGFRISALPSRVDAAWSRLRAAGAELLAYPGLHLVFARFPVAAPDAAFAAAAEAARIGRGGFVCEAAPPEAKRDREMFGELGPAFPLFRALKRRFDPGGVLNPGRFVGGL